MDNIISIKKGLKKIGNIEPDDSNIIAIKNASNTLLSVLEAMEEREKDIISKEALLIMSKHIKTQLVKVESAQERVYENAVERIESDMDKLNRSYKGSLTAMSESLRAHKQQIANDLYERENQIAHDLCEQKLVLNKSIARLASYRMLLFKTTVTIAVVWFFAGLIVGAFI